MHKSKTTIGMPLASTMLRWLTEGFTYQVPCMEGKLQIPKKPAAFLGMLAFLCFGFLSSGASFCNPAIAQNGIPDAGFSNTLLSGIVVDRFGQPVPELIEVIVSSCKGTHTTQLLAHGGLFAHDFKHELPPTERIRIEVLAGPLPSSPVSYPKLEDSTGATTILHAVAIAINPASWSGASKEILLHEAQNITLTVDYIAPYVGNYHLLAMSGMPLPSEWRIIPQAMPFIMPLPAPRIYKPCKPLDRSCTDR